jgi:hypothetical protein
MKRALLVLLLLLLAAPFVAFAWAAYFGAQRADYGWTPTVESPAFPREHPRVLVDGAHHNASTIDFAGRYWPFGRLLRADGYAVAEAKGPFTREGLERVRVLVIANASGAANPQAFGINLVGGSQGRRDAPAFTREEIAAVRAWVEAGGSLLLIADHAPFGAAAADLGRAFGVAMHQGFTEVTGEKSDPLEFSRANGRLGDHPVTRGVERVQTFTGQSLDAPPGAAILLRLPANAVEAVERGDSLVEQPAGAAQGLALEFGKGRVIVLGEAAMATAQVAERKRFGMNLATNDNRLFVLNAMRWLARAL